MLLIALIEGVVQIRLCQFYNLFLIMLAPQRQIHYAVSIIQFGFGMPVAFGQRFSYQKIVESRMKIIISVDVIRVPQAIICLKNLCFFLFRHPCVVALCNGVETENGAVNVAVYVQVIVSLFQQLVRRDISKLCR